MPDHIVRNAKVTFAMRVLYRGPPLQHLLNPFGRGKAQALLKQFLLGCPPKKHVLSSEMVRVVPSFATALTLLSLHLLAVWVLQRDFGTLKG